MKEKILSLKNKPVVLLAAAAVLLLLSTVGATQAAITSYSETYNTTIHAPEVAVSLLENDAEVPVNETDSNAPLVLLSQMLAQSEGKLIPGKTYKEELKVKNTGTTDAYVRVVIAKNWSDADGNIDRNLSPENIEILLVETGDWVKDSSASTDERTVLYYKNVLQPEAVSSLFMENVKVRSGFDLIVEENTVNKTTATDGTEYKTISYSHPYDGYKMNVTVEVDTVQTYDAVEAIKSAWGVTVEASEADGSLTFKF